MGVGWSVFEFWASHFLCFFVGRLADGGGVSLGFTGLRDDEWYPVGNGSPIFI